MKPDSVPFADLTLGRRLEDAEGFACAQFAAARRRAFPESGADWMRQAGAYVVFDGVESPVTQTFGLGILGELRGDSLDVIERFFQERGAPVQHEVSPLAGLAVMDLLCERRYRPMEISSVLYRPVEQPIGEDDPGIEVRIAGPGETDLWTEVNAKGWTYEHPELLDFIRQFGSVGSAREGSVSFLGSLDGQPGAAGALAIHDGVALFAGAATVPELRRRGLQGALLRARMRYAYEAGCDLAMMVAEAGSNSQRNAERQGFRIAYTRMKWRLDYRHRS